MLRLDAIPGSVRSLLLRLGPLKGLEEFALGGGTSLALRFGHRVSVDLDFFTQLEFQPDELSGRLGLENVTVIGRASNSLSLVVNDVKVDLLRHAYKMIEPVDTIDGIRLISLPDVAAMKLNAIANRGSKKDFYDLVELLNHFTIQQMIGFFADKYPATDPFTVIRSLAWFEDAEPEPEPVSLTCLKWDRVKTGMCEAVARL